MRFSLSLLTFAAFSALPMLAHGELICENGDRANISGRVTTVNISATKQAGQICLILTNSHGKEVFDQCGAIIGKVVSSDPQVGSTILNHTVLFSKNQAFSTLNDAAQITGVLALDASGAPCAFNVVEKISNINWSLGIVDTGNVDINALGTVSFCPSNNMNNFALSGEVCLRKAHR